MIHCTCIFIYKTGYSPSQNRCSFSCGLTILGVDCSFLLYPFIINLLVFLFYGLIIKCCFRGRFRLLDGSIFGCS